MGKIAPHQCQVIIFFTSGRLLKVKPKAQVMARKTHARGVKRPVLLAGFPVIFLPSVGVIVQPQPVQNRVTADEWWLNDHTRSSTLFAGRRFLDHPEYHRFISSLGREAHLASRSRSRCPHATRSVGTDGGRGARGSSFLNRKHQTSQGAIHMHLRYVALCVFAF